MSNLSSQSIVLLNDFNAKYENTTRLESSTLAKLITSTCYLSAWMIHVPFLLILTYDKLPNSITRETVYGCLYYPILAHNQRITRSTQTRFSWQTIQIRRHFDFNGSTFPSLSLPSIRSSKTGTTVYNVVTFTDTGHECLFRLCLQRDLRTAFSPTATDTLKNLRILNIWDLIPSTGTHT